MPARVLPVVLFGSASGDGLLETRWGQRWAFGQFAPEAILPSDQGGHERLGCQSTALAQISFFHKLCPSGAVSYQASNHPATAMDFDDAAERGLCDWTGFGLSPPNVTEDPTMVAVARFEYALALVVEKKWGTGSYVLRKHAERADSFEGHFPGALVTRSVTGRDGVTRDDLVDSIQADLDRGLPLMLQIGSESGSYHWIVIDGYRSTNSTFDVHLNIGHSGFDNGWFHFDSPICLKHYPNGTQTEDSSCAALYDRVDFKELWSIHPPANTSVLV